MVCVCVNVKPSGTMKNNCHATHMTLQTQRLHQGTHNKLYKQERGAFNQIKIIIIKAKSSENINNCGVQM